MHSIPLYCVTTVIDLLKSLYMAYWWKIYIEDYQSNAHLHLTWGHTRVTSR